MYNIRLLVYLKCRREGEEYNRRSVERSRCASTDEAIIDWTKALNTGRIHDTNYTIHVVYQKKNSKYDPYRESSENFYYEKRGRQICAIYIAHRETITARTGEGERRRGDSMESDRINEPPRKHSAGGRDLGDRKRRHLIQETPVAHSHGFRVPVTRQWDVVAAATAAKHFAAIATVVPASHDRESRLAGHASWRVVVWHPSRCSLDAFFSSLGDRRGCCKEKIRED